MNYNDLNYQRFLKRKGVAPALCCRSQTSKIIAEEESGGAQNGDNLVLNKMMKGLGEILPRRERIQRRFKKHLPIGMSEQPLSQP